MLMMNGRRGRGQKLRSEGLDRFISLLSKSKVGKARCKDRRSGGGQRGGGGGQGADGRQGWQGRRAGSSNSIHGCVQAGCRTDRWFCGTAWAGLRPCLDRVTGVTGATGVWFTLSAQLEKLWEYLGTEGMTILGPGSWFWALGLPFAGSRSRTSLVRARLVACNAASMQWMQYDTAIQYCTVQDSYGTVRYCLTIWLLCNSNDKDKAQAQASPYTTCNMEARKRGGGARRSGARRGAEIY